MRCIKNVYQISHIKKYSASKAFVLRGKVKLLAPNRTISYRHNLLGDGENNYLNINGKKKTGHKKAIMFQNLAHFIS